MKKFFASALLIFTASGFLHGEVSVKVRDIAVIDGLKENQVFGFGLVVGLQGTGDSKNFTLTNSLLKNLMKNMGLEGDNFISKNAAAVMITAVLPAYSRIGDKFDVAVSSIGDAKSLEGGMLIQSVLRGSDNISYAAAQGALIVSSSKGGGKSVKTAARVAGGGIIEREIKPEPVTDGNVFLTLRSFDFTVADSVIKAVKDKYSATDPKLTDSGKIQIIYDGRVPLAEFISTIESIEVAPSTRSIVVIYERDATVAAGGEVKISEAMVCREGITVEIGSGKKGSAHHIQGGATVKELVDAMNATGATTRDIILILKALKESGALHAELVVR